MNNVSSLERILVLIGDAWGRLSTVALALAIAVLPILQGLDPQLLATHPWIGRVVIGLSLAIAVLRVLAPPPPSVPIKRDDEVVVDEAAGTVTIAKATEVPANVVSKAAGEKV